MTAIKRYTCFHSALFNLLFTSVYKAVRTFNSVDENLLRSHLIRISSYELSDFLMMMFFVMYGVIACGSSMLPFR